MEEEKEIVFCLFLQKKFTKRIINQGLSYKTFLQKQSASPAGKLTRLIWLNIYEQGQSLPK
jgi:hypothetical protein